MRKFLTSRYAFSTLHYNSVTEAAFDLLFIFITSFTAVQASQLFSFPSFCFSAGGQPMEREFKGSICTNPQGKPVVHYENSKK